MISFWLCALGVSRVQNLNVYTFVAVEPADTFKISLQMIQLAGGLYRGPKLVAINKLNGYTKK